MNKANTVYLTVLLAILSFTFCYSQPIESKMEGDALESYIDSLILPFINDSKIAGFAIGIAKDDTVIFKKSYGYAHHEYKEVLSNSTSFEIGSITKQFTAVAIMQLAEQDLLNLEDPITDYVSYDTKGNDIRIHHLLSHTSGIRGYPSESTQFLMSQPYPPRDTLLSLIEKEDLYFAPGTAMIYSNTGYFILGLIIEEVAGMSYEKYVDENIFAKASMNHSSYCYSEDASEQSAYGHISDGAGGFSQPHYINFKWPFAAAGLCSTTGDLIQWLYVIHNTEWVLTKDSYNQLISPSTLNDGTGLNYGYGLISNEYGGQIFLGHHGGTPGFYGTTSYYPEHGLAIVTLMNTEGELETVQFSKRIAEYILPIQAGPQYNFEGDLKSYEGTYIGPTRNGESEIQIKSNDAYLISIEGDEVDTLRYNGDSSWVKLDTRSSFVSEFSFTKNNQATMQLHLDIEMGHYIFQKVE